jgi:hypothetical protein
LAAPLALWQLGRLERGSAPLVAPLLGWVCRSRDVLETSLPTEKKEREEKAGNHAEARKKPRSGKADHDEATLRRWRACSLQTRPPFLRLPGSSIRRWHD